MLQAVKCFCFSLLVLCCLFSKAVAQEPAEDDVLVVQRALEYLIENAEEEIDFTDLQIRLLDRLGDPINLNKASFETLQELEILNETQILAIIQHREKHGPFLSIYELQAVEGFDNSLIRIIMPFLTVEEKLDRERITFDKLVSRGRTEWFFRYRNIIEPQRGYAIADTSTNNEGYLGSDYQAYTRINYRYQNNLSLGITAEKDMGEQFFSGSQPQGFDYYSGHMYLGDIGKLQSLAIGDYQMQAGQGLTMWSGLGFGKSADVMNIAKRGRNISPYRGANENQFLRGLAATYQLGRFELTGFYSNKSIDGNALSEGDTLNPDNGAFTAFQLSGLHRTQAEVDDKDAVQEQIYGTRLSTSIGTWRIGATAVQTTFDQELSRDIQPYQVLDFQGDAIGNIGLDYSGIWRSAYFFGEVAYGSTNQAFATVNGVLLSLSHQLDAAVVYRNYAPGYISLYANAFRESSKAQNERGMYVSLRYKPNQYWTFGAYLDQFTFPWLRYRNDLPSRGHEYFADVEYRPSRRINFYMRYKYQRRQANTSDFDKLRHVVNEDNGQLRLQFRYNPKPLQFTTRIQFSGYKLADTSNASGILMFQDVAFRPMEKPYYFIARYALFNVSDFDARIYAYENDVLYAFSIPFFQGRGHRYYALFRYKLGRHVDLWFRYARTYFHNQESVGSGLEAISGNTRSEIKVQLRIKF